MSQENVEIVRRIYAKWAPGFSPSESNLLHRDIEWVNPPDALEPGTRKGIDAFTSIIEDLDDTIGGFRMDVELLIDVGDRVLVIATMRGHGTGSGVEIDNRHGAVWSIRDGKAVRFQWFHEPAQAFEAVGLRE
jgi:ketosteroid isomerase-like protein